jgi:DNA polymerase III psi subunit
MVGKVITKSQIIEIDGHLFGCRGFRYLYRVHDLHKPMFCAKKQNQWAFTKECEAMAESENTILHNFVLTELFKETYLVDLSPSANNNIQEHSPALFEVLVFHHHTQNELPSNENVLLQAILNACKLNSDETAVFSRSVLNQNNLKDLLEKHQPKKIILFGVDPAAIGLPIHFPIFQIQAYQNIQYLHAPALSELESDKQLKIQLWQKLKQLFP